MSQEVRESVSSCAIYLEGANYARDEFVEYLL